MNKCKGEKCRALYGVGHSKECIDQHENANHVGAGNRNPEARYRGYTMEPLSGNPSSDEEHAWKEGFLARSDQNITEG